MKMMSTRRILPVLLLSAFVLTAGHASAQTGQSSWNAEASVGWDVNVTGAFLAAGIGTLDQSAAVINAQSFGDVYGTGVLWQFSGGYMVDEINEVRAQLSYQRAGSDIVNLGTANGTDLVATFDDYKSWTVEAGYRHFFATRDVRLRPYGGGTIGVAIIDEIDGVFAAPQAGITRSATDFYDGTAALSLGVNGGALYGLKTGTTSTRRSACASTAACRRSTRCAEPAWKASTTRALAGRCRSASAFASTSKTGSNRNAVGYRSRRPTRRSHCPVDRI